jgi:hypothetical protein
MATCEHATVTSIQPVTPTAQGEIPAQFRPGFAHWIFVVGVVVNYDWKQRYTMDLALYRPGYELVVIESWGSLDRVVWNPALTIEAQMKTLDNLFPISEPDLQHASGTEREVMLFIGSEYARLAALTQSREPGNEQLQEQLLKKAQACRDMSK